MYRLRYAALAIVLALVVGASSADATTYSGTTGFHRAGVLACTPQFGGVDAQLPSVGVTYNGPQYVWAISHLFSWSGSAWTGTGVWSRWSRAYISPTPPNTAVIGGPISQWHDPSTGEVVEYHRFTTTGTGYWTVMTWIYWQPVAGVVNHGWATVLARQLNSEEYTWCRTV